MGALMEILGEKACEMSEGEADIKGEASGPPHICCYCAALSLCFLWLLVTWADDILQSGTHHSFSSRYLHFLSGSLLYTGGDISTKGATVVQEVEKSTLLLRCASFGNRVLCLYPLFYA